MYAIRSYYDKETQRIAMVIYGVSISIGIATLIGFMGVIFVFDEKMVSSIALTIFFIVGLSALILSKRGLVRIASIILLTTLWLVTCSVVAVSGGMRSLDTMFFITGTAVAGLLLGQYGAIYYGGASILAGMVLIVINAVGITRNNFV